MSTSIPITIAGSKLPVMERFYTIQGEGKHTGHAAYFIRLGGCDVGCVWCDVKESWDADAHPKIAILTLVDDAIKSGAKNVVITGGEPAMYNLAELTDALHQAGLTTWIETSGAHGLTGQWDWVCFSPKKFKAPLPEFYPAADELKIVVFNKHDFKWAEEHAAKVSGDCELYLQPEWDKEQEMLPLIIDYVKKHPQWKISLQTHKYMDIP